MQAVRPEIYPRGINVGGGARYTRPVSCQKRGFDSKRSRLSIVESIALQQYAIEPQTHRAKWRKRSIFKDLHLNGLTEAILGFVDIC